MSDMFNESPDKTLFGHHKMVDLVSAMANQQAPSDAFFVKNPEQVERAVAEFKSCLPNITPYFAVKANPSPWLVDKLAQLGVYFDCASKQEIELVLNATGCKSPSVAEDAANPLSLPSSLPNKLPLIVYSNPIKRISDLDFALSHGVSVMAVDTLDEIAKIASRVHVVHRHPQPSLMTPHANEGCPRCPEHLAAIKLLIRFRVDDHESKMSFAKKFGASSADCLVMAKEAKRLGLDVCGCSFHIGTGGNSHPGATFATAMRHGITLMNEFKSLGFNPTILDIGGGFCVETGITKDTQSAILEAAKSVPFVIAEPGRFFSHRSLDFVVRVIGKRICKDGRVGYHLDDGIYHNFNCVVHDMFVPSHRKVCAVASAEIAAAGVDNGSTTSDDDAFIGDLSNPKLALTNVFMDAPGPLETCRLFGMTCDGADVIADSIDLPHLEIGDWLYWPDFGAYTVACATNFNGLHIDKEGHSFL